MTNSEIVEWEIQAEIELRKSLGSRTKHPDPELYDLIERTIPILSKWDNIGKLEKG